MSYLGKFFLVLGIAVSIATSALASDKGTAKEAEAMVAKALAEVKANGIESSTKTFSDPKWRDRDLYVFVGKFDGTIIAHGANAGLIGKNLNELKDADGKTFVREMAEVAKTKQKGWVDYYWSNPTTKKVEPKSTYVTAIPGQDAYVAVGIYK
ncbi:cache domain-containing protein [Propionivibrio sp.]|uniref:cache domain-containing protein n=1 Tax=Propionivibrio sp. TaxID=2212460 RepID=UPI00260358AD|nr:cache domain-containing protein [Propionivibrio sp.]